jgi:GTP1/Obg family GTP-binding protein
VNIDDIDKFQGNLTRFIEERFNTTNTDGGSHDLDEPLSEMTNKQTEIEKLIQEYQKALKEACDKSFRQRTMKKITKYKSVPWCRDELTVMRKMINSLRRSYQRIRKHEGLSEQR